MSYIPLDVNSQLLENILGQLDIKVSQLRDDLRGVDSRTLTDLYNIESGIKTQTDKLTYDASSYLYVRIGASDVSLGGGVAQLQVRDSANTWTDVGYYTGNLNVPIDIQSDSVGLATESTLSGIKTQTDKLTFDASSYLYVNAAVVANPSNLDVALSTRASETTLSGIKTQTDKLTFDTSNYLYVNIGSDSVGLATESTLSGIKTQTDKLTFDASSYLYVNAATVANPSNLDVALSTRLSETTFTGRWDGGIYGWDGTAGVKVHVDSSGDLQVDVLSMPSLPSGTNTIGAIYADFSSSSTINGTVDTTEVTGTAIDVRRGGRKVIYIDNSQDVDITVTVEGSYDGTDWYTIRSGISVPTGTKKVGILNDAYGYVRAKAVASASPTSGSVLIEVSRMT